jgi:hypothetical protein
MKTFENSTRPDARALTIEINERMHVPELVARQSRSRFHTEILRAFTDQQDEIDRLAAQLTAAEGVIQTQARELNRLRRALLPASPPAAPHPEHNSSGLVPTAANRLSWWRRNPSSLAETALCA